jgi:hypothetical protein
MSNLLMMDNLILTGIGFLALLILGMIVARLYGAPRRNARSCAPASAARR